MKSLYPQYHVIYVRFWFTGGVSGVIGASHNIKGDNGDQSISCNPCFLLCGNTIWCLWHYFAREHYAMFQVHYVMFLSIWKQGFCRIYCFTLCSKLWSAMKSHRDVFSKLCLVQFQSWMNSPHLNLLRDHRRTPNNVLDEMYNVHSFLAAVCPERTHIYKYCSRR